MCDDSGDAVTGHERESEGEKEVAKRRTLDEIDDTRASIRGLQPGRFQIAMGKHEYITYTHIYIYINMCTYLHIFVYIYIYTYIYMYM